jgi:hypothetical protein
MGAHPPNSVFSIIPEVSLQNMLALAFLVYCLTLRNNVEVREKKVIGEHSSAHYNFRAGLGYRHMLNILFPRSPTHHFQGEEDGTT